MADKTGRAALAPTNAARKTKNASKRKSTRTGPYVNSRIRTLRKKVAAATWDGPMNARAVLLALLDIGTEIAPYVFAGIPAVPGDDSTHPDYDITIGAPVRRLAELAGMSRNVASIALRWLEDNRYICRAREFGGCHRSTKWQLGPATRAHLSKNGTDNINDFILSVPKLDTSGGIWDSALLGRNAERVYSALSSEPATISAIARAAGMKWDTARKHLDALRAVNLSAATETGWTRGPATLADAARALDADAARQARRDRNATEREAYREQGGYDWEEASSLIKHRAVPAHRIPKGRVALQWVDRHGDITTYMLSDSRELENFTVKRGVHPPNEYGSWESIGADLAAGRIPQPVWQAPYDERCYDYRGTELDRYLLGYYERERWLANLDHDIATDPPEARTRFLRGIAEGLQLKEGDYTLLPEEHWRRVADETERFLSENPSPATADDVAALLCSLRSQMAGEGFCTPRHTYTIRYREDIR